MMEHISMKIISIISLMLAVLSFSASGNADIYKFVDDEGVIHLTNIPKHDEYKRIITEHTIQRKASFSQLIRSASSKYGIDPSLINAMITVESNWDSTAVSRKGAIGLMQIMPTTADDMQILNPFDPAQNIEAGTRYLRFLLDRFNGELDLALAAYNAGPTTVERSGGVPAIAETRKYIRKVLSIHNKQYHPPRAKIYKVTDDSGTILFTDNPSGI